MTIQELRKSMGLSQSKFAKYYGLNIRTLQDWERGRCNPPSYLVDLLVRLNKAEEHNSFTEVTSENMNCDIIIRYKNSKGNVIGYRVRYTNGTEQDVTPQFLESNVAAVNNAILINGFGFKAKDGCRIDTKIIATELYIRNNRPKLIEQKPTDFENIQTIRGYNYINICRRIRKKAQDGRLIVDKTPHRVNDGRNVYLFDLIESCGISVDEFIRGYLAELQPYSLSPYIYPGSTDKDAWMVDTGYGVSLIIKVNNVKTDKEAIIISFHESNKRGNPIISKEHYDKDDDCIVICDTIGKKECDMFPITFTVQRGFIRHRIKCNAIRVSKDIAVIPYSIIEEKYKDSLNTIMERLSGLYFSDTSYNVVPTVENLDKISFLAFGHADINSIVFLIDMYERDTSGKSKPLIVQITNELLNELSDERIKEISVGLANKYNIVDKDRVSKNPLLNFIKENIV